MLSHVSWAEMLSRLALAGLAGVLVGFNREARSQAAGLRTTTLVCLAACLAMVLANRLLGTTGKTEGSFVQVDVMRLPLGVLSGMGFLGAGAIIRRGDVVSGVATAATLWFMTMVGLAIGAGELGLGVVATGLGLGVVWGLKHADRRIRRKFRGQLTVIAEPDLLAEDELRRLLADAGQQVVAWAVSYKDGGRAYEVRTEVEWRGLYEDRGRAPSFLKPLADRPGVRESDWTPQAIAG